MTVHIGAKPGDIAETVLLPGDPCRARWAAQTFLQDARPVGVEHHCQDVAGSFSTRGSAHSR